MLGVVRLWPGAERVFVCFFCAIGDEGQAGVRRVLGLVVFWDAVVRLLGVPPVRNTFDMFLLMFLLCVSILFDSNARGDIGGESVTIFGGGSFSEGNGTLQTSMFRIVPLFEGAKDE